MESKRLAVLEEFIAASPNDCFARYGAAQERIKLGEFDKALEQFEKILEINEDYQAAYYHAGKTCEKLARADDARSFYRRGIEAAARGGDPHARSELEAALEELG